MVTTTATVINTVSKTVDLHVKYSTTTEHTHLKQSIAVVRVIVSLRMPTTVVISTTYKQ
jgi:hypothetical protein